MSGEAAFASLFEGGGSPKGLPEGVSYRLRTLPQSKIGSEEPIFASPLYEGAKGVSKPVNNNLSQYPSTKISLPGNR